MDSHLTKLEAEIANVEIALGALPKTKKHARERKALEAKHEDLVMRVQQSTVGAAKPGQVL
jgi:hypothetical protein